MARPDLQLHQVDRRSVIPQEDHDYEVIPQEDQNFGSLHLIVKRSASYLFDRSYNDGKGNFVRSSRMVSMFMPQRPQQNDQTLELELSAK